MCEIPLFSQKVLNSEEINCGPLSETIDLSIPCRLKISLRAHILRFHVTSLILGERIAAISIPQQCTQWLSVKSNRWRSERIHCYFKNNKNRTLIIIL